MALSDVAIKKAKAGEKSRKLYDERGLYLLLDKGGGKYWRMKYRFGGKERLFSIGTYPDVGLAEARQRRDDARRLLRDGKDPSAEKAQKKRREKVAAASSFESVARAWIKVRREKLSTGHAERVLKSLEDDVFPHIGAKPIAEITTPDVLYVLKKVEARGAYDVVGRIKQRISSVFKYGIAHHYATYNAAAQVASEALPSRTVQHRRHLKRDEMPEFLTKLDSYDGQPLTKLALRLCVLTFVRSGEIRGARWSEFNIDRAEWRIPAERMKMKNEHIVPLSTQALAVIEAIRELTGDDQHGRLFPSQNGDGKVMSENTLLYALYRMGYHQRATVHGFRSTASTILNESGFRADVIERQLAHIEGNKVRRAYNHAEYLPERVRMMQAWADMLDGMAQGANVTPIRGRAA